MSTAFVRGGRAIASWLALGISIVAAPSQAQCCPAPSPPPCDTLFFETTGAHIGDHEVGDVRSVIVATVPDPTIDELASEYDAFLDAILRGAESAGLHREGRIATPATHDCSLSCPGAIAFDGVDGRVLVLLVAESPSEGVPHDAMTAAIHFALHAPREEAPLVLLGPSYSGSAPSIRRAIPSDSLGQLQVFTGAATSDRLAEALGVASDRLHRPIAADSATIGAFYQHLRDRHGVEALNQMLMHVGLLVESGSGWGATSAVRSEDALVPEFTVRFPIGIGFLREAVDAAESAARDAARHDAPDWERIGAPLGVGLHFDAPTGASLPYRPTAEAVSAMDVGLDVLLSRVAQARLRFIGIQATHVADGLFLAERLAEVAPDARVFFLNNDALYYHRDRRADVLGAFVVTTYPFLGAGPFWDAADAPRDYVSFANDVAEGEYNATLLAVSSLSSGTPPSLRDLPRAAGESSAPPVSIGLVGTDGFLPLAVSPDDTRSHPQLDPDVAPPTAWQILFFVIAVAVAFDRRMVLARLSSAKSLREHVHRTPTDPVYPFATPRVSLAAHAVLRRAVAWAAFLLFAAVDVFAIWTPDSPFDVSERAYPSLVVVVCFVVALADVLRGRRSATDYAITELQTVHELVITRRAATVTAEDGDDESRAAFLEHVQRYVPAALGAILFVGVLFGALGALGSGESPTDRSLLCLRMVTLFSGVSPIPPILLGLTSVWLVAIGRMALASDLAAVTGTGAVGPIARVVGASLARPASRKTLADAEHRLIGTLIPPVTVRSVLMIAGALAIPMFAFLIKSPSSIENTPWFLARLVHDIPWASALIPLVTSATLFLPVAIAAVLTIALLRDVIRFWLALREMLRAVLLRPASRFLGKLPTGLAVSVDRALSGITNDAMKLTLLHGLARRTTLDRPARLAAREELLGACVGLNTRPDTLSVARRMIGHGDGQGDATRAGAAANLLSLEDSLFGLARGVNRLVECEGRAQSWEPAVPSEQKAEAEKETASPDGVFVAATIALVALRYVRLVRHYVITMTPAALLLVLAVACYPLQPRRLFSMCAWLLIASIATTSIGVFADLDRNTVLCRIAGTSPGSHVFDPALLRRVLTYVGIPVLSLVASQHSDVASWLYSLAEPFIRAVR